ncbi:ChrR family anti-sigma-E factor [Roseomonas harenae]|uniref:ChrR family anti-sigma-E factor n=1 Tax=Muricoccus harenae TaxID=2692566 RepID=UPI00133124F8|nr:ChrR family anti-sigma-E factor [Roseomonas harenae]
MTGEGYRTARRHPSAATLAFYGAGHLGQAAGIAVAAHLLHCEHCLTAVSMAEEVVGPTIPDLPLSPLAPDALQRTMDRIHADYTAPPDVLSTGGLPVPTQGAAITLDRLGLPPPRLRWAAPGVRIARLLQERWGSNDCETLLLLRVAPGVALPGHGHEGSELTCVLEGAFADETGQYGAGDMAEAEEDVRHRPVAEGRSDCVCLIATRGRLRFPGLIGRLAGAYLRI